MRILYHHRTQAEDAQGIHIYEMVKAFRKLEHEVEVVALVKLDEANEEKTQGRSWNKLTRWIPAWLYEVMSLSYNLYGYLHLRRVIRSKKFDLIYERYSLNTFCGIWASRHFGIPMVLEVNLPLYYQHRHFGKLTLKRFARFSERWICSHSTYTVVVSNAMKELLIEEGVPGEKLIVMHNGVDPQNFNPNISSKIMRQRYGLRNKLVIGFVGWFREWHGLEMLLEIMHESRLAEQGVHLLLVGDGPAYPTLYQYAEKHDLLSSVVFTGPIRRLEIPAHIAAMDIAVLPKTNDYGCPMKLMEYMVMRKCVGAPDQSPIREIIENGVTGLLFKMGNKEDLRSTLMKLLRNPLKRERLGQNAYQSVFDRGFLWQANAEKTLRLASGESYEYIISNVDGDGEKTNTKSVTCNQP